MSDDLIIQLWSLLAFRPKLTEQESQLLETCSKRLLELIGDPREKTI